MKAGLRVRNIYMVDAKRIVGVNLWSLKQLFQVNEWFALFPHD